MPEITETKETFHGRKVIRVDGFFFIEQGPVGIEDFDNRWISEQKMNYVHQGVVYNRQDATPEACKYFPWSEPITAEDLAMPFYELKDDGTMVEVPSPFLSA